MTLFRVTHNKEYTCVNNFICTDIRISWKAKGIWLYAFSRNDDWQFNLTDLINRSSDSRDSVKSGLKELEEFGYLTRVQHRENGAFSKAEWQFHEKPFKKSLPQTENPSTVLASTEKRPLISTQNKVSTQEELLPEEVPSEVAASQVIAPSEVVVSFEKLDLKDSLKRKLLKAHSPEKLNLAIERTLKWKSRATDEAGIMTVLREWNTWNDAVSKEDFIEKHKKYLRDNSKMDGQIVGDTKISILKDGVQFAWGNNFKVILVTERNFIEQVLEYFKSCKQRGSKQQKGIKPSKETP